jgi:hypothetical protein
VLVIAHGHDHMCVHVDLLQRVPNLRVRVLLKWV